MTLSDLTAMELSDKIKKREIRVREGLDAVFGEIDRKEKLLHCYLTLERERAYRKAEELEKKILSGELTGPLAGVPVAVKDNMCTEGIRTTCASRMLENFVPCYQAHAVTCLEKAGAILIGKANMDEFSMGSTTETSAFGCTRNPVDPVHVPGGSSGGCAAAVASGEAFFALGSDTGGSIRQPASHCGVVGMKPTYGRVSRYGLIAYGSSLEQIGPIAKDVRDCAAVLQAIAGRDDRDATSVGGKDTDFLSALKEDVSGMRIGIPEEYLEDGIADPVRDRILEAADRFRNLGAAVESFPFPMADYAVPAYYTVASAEAGSNLARFDGVKYGYRAEDCEGLYDMYKKTRSRGFGEEVKRRIMLGTFVLSSGYYDAYYLKAMKVRNLIRKSVREVFERYDIVMGPTAPAAAPEIGVSLKDPMKMYLSDLYTVVANLAGIPAVSLPCGKDDTGLPVGLQLCADCFEEKKLFQAAFTYEKAGENRKDGKQNEKRV